MASYLVSPPDHSADWEFGQNDTPEILGIQSTATSL